MYRTAIVLTLCALIAQAYGQGTPQFTHQVATTQADQLPARDFWFTMARNYENQSGKYYELYVTSKQATTVYIQVKGSTSPTKRAIKTMEVFAFKIPLGWEVTTSGIVEDLGIHVWSDDADLNVNLLSRNPYTSDGMNIIPVSGWGTEYVVAAYNSLYEGFGTTYDYPSEFSIVAAYDDTRVTIKPTIDIRKTGQPTEVLYRKGDTFNITLNRGQVIQFMATLAQDADNFDVTGTVVTSTKPIGIVGASQCPNIPPEYPYCDHICEMIPPVNMWGMTYYSVPFYNRKGGDSFVMIASKDNQTIYFNGVPVTKLNKYEHLFRPDIVDAGKWWSDAPFFVAQYINSTEWPDPVTGQTNNGIGDPAMVFISPLEQFAKEVLFQTPTITTGTGYTHYANIIVHKDAVSTTTMDGIPINSYPSAASLPIPFSNYVNFRARSLKSGAHFVKSDSTVGVYIYGYGSYDSYAWNGGLSAGKIWDADTVAPVVSISGDCNCARINLNDVLPNSSGLGYIVIDTSFNISFYVDPNFSPGTSKDSSFYNICIQQPSQEGFIAVSVYDMSGNRTVITSRIEARTAPTATPTSLSIPFAGPSIPNYASFTLKNTTPSTLPLMSVNGLRFIRNNGFDLVSPDLSDLFADSSRNFLVRYKANDTEKRRDTIVVSSECYSARIPLQSLDIRPVASLFGFNAGCILLGSVAEDTALLRNNVLYELTVESITVDDTVHFKPQLAVLPLTLKAEEQLNIRVLYYANEVDSHWTTLQVRTKELGDFTAIISGCSLPSGDVRSDGASSNESELNQALGNGKEFAWLAPIPNPSNRSSTVSFVFGLSKQATVTLDFFDLVGKHVYAISPHRYESGIHEISFDTRMLIAGTYVYRYSVDGKPYSGVLTVR